MSTCFGTLAPSKPSTSIWIHHYTHTKPKSTPLFRDNLPQKERKLLGWIMTDIKLAVMFHQYFIITVSVGLKCPFKHSREEITWWLCTLLPLHFVLHAHNFRLFRLVFFSLLNNVFVVVPLHVKKLIIVLYFLRSLQTVPFHLRCICCHTHRLHSDCNLGAVSPRIWTLIHRQAWRSC